MSLIAKLHQSEPDEPAVMACLVDAPKLPNNQWIDFAEPFLVACIRRNKDNPDLWEWATYDEPDWKESIGDLLLKKEISVNEWKWITLHYEEET